MLEARGLIKNFGARRAVDDFTHRFAEGRITTILGPSGSGKSTTLMLMAGLTNSDRGTILLDGRDITGLSAEQRNFGFVFQNYSLFPHLTVQKNVEFGLRVRGVNAEERTRRARETLALMRINHLGERRITDISGGEQQRVAIARALSFRPKILLMDEPLSALDAKLRDELRSELLRLLTELAITTIYVTHDQVEAMSLGSEMIILNQGRIEQVGVPAALYQQPANLFVANFVGDSNVYAAERQGDQLHLPFAIINTSANGYVGESCWAMLRPETLELAREEEADFSARLESSLFLGNRVRLHLRAGVERIVLDTDNHRTFVAEQLLYIRIKPHKVATWPRTEN